MGELLEAGLLLTATGMGVVFVLLAILVGAMHVLARFCRLLEGSPPPRPAEQLGAENAEVDGEIAGVITAAVRAFRRGGPKPGAV